MQDIYVGDTGKGFPLVLVHGFLGSSKMWEPQIEFLKKENINVIIKLHPSYFNPNHNYDSDQNYLKYISKLFFVNLYKLKEEVVLYSESYNVHFVTYEVSLPELSNIFNKFLCITHHGSVACESSYLGHSAICSTASAYTVKDLFVKLYTSKEEYLQLIIKWKKNLFENVNNNSLYEYIYQNYLISDSVALEHLILKYYNTCIPVDNIYNLEVYLKKQPNLNDKEKLILKILEEKIIIHNGIK